MTAGRNGTQTRCDRLWRARIGYRAISELISDFAYSLRPTPQGTLALDWVTAAFSRITGLPTEDFVTMEDLLMIVHPEDRASGRAHFNALVSGQTDERELRILTRDGTVRWLRLVGSPEGEPDTRGRRESTVPRRKSRHASTPISCLKAGRPNGRVSLRSCWMSRIKWPPPWNWSHCSA